MKKSVKSAALAALCGTVLGSGCLGINWETILWGSVIYAGFEFITDNDSVFDLFESGNVAAAE